jgi:glycosyltransferase involved in cell wall biosynthesis
MRALFISHDASRTGAPILLLHYLKWLWARREYDFDVLLLKGGDLQREFEAVAPTTVLSRHSSLPTRWLTERVRARLVTARLRARRFDVVYANTVVTGGHAIDIAAGRCPVVWHIHEMDFSIRELAGPTRFNAEHPKVAKLIAVSGAVRSDLVDRYGVPSEKVELIHEFIPLPASADGQESARRRIRGELGIPEHAVVVGAAGTLDWRKGADLFVPMALLTLRQLPGVVVHFVWIGGHTASYQHSQALYDVRAARLASFVHFVGNNENPLDYFAAMDVFALLSREDPFPLVMLEAGALAKPLVCFAGAGGADELIAAGGGVSVPYLDVPAMASALASLILDASRRATMGADLRKVIRARHALEVSAPRVSHVIESVLERPRTVG